MGDVKRRRAAALAVVLCLAVFAGEYLTYYSGIHEFDASAEWGEDGVSFQVSSSGSDVYSAVLIDNGGHSPVTELVILADENYRDHYDEVAEATGLEFLDQEYYAEQILNALENRSFDDVTIVDTEGLARYLQDTMGDPSSKGILVMTYALPSEIYAGAEDDLLMRWVSAGGTLYWLGSEIGAYYTDDDELHEVERNQQLFFGRVCVNTDGPELAEAVVDNGFTEALSLKGSRLIYGVDVGGLDDVLSVGYTADGYSTVSLIGYGDGAVCVFSGTFDIDQIDDVGQVVASGITPYSRIAGCETGKVVRGTVSGEIGSDGSVLYVSIGGTYTKYGEAFYA